MIKTIQVGKLTVLYSTGGGAVSSDGARFAVAEADGETVVETALSRAEAMIRARDIAEERARAK